MAFRTFLDQRRTHTVYGAPAQHIVADTEDHGHLDYWDLTNAHNINLDTVVDEGAPIPDSLSYADGPFLDAINDGTDRSADFTVTGSSDWVVLDDVLYVERSWLWAWSFGSLQLGQDVTTLHMDLPDRSSAQISWLEPSQDGVDTFPTYFADEMYFEVDWLDATTGKSLGTERIQPSHSETATPPTPFQPLVYTNIGDSGGVSRLGQRWYHFDGRWVVYAIDLRVGNKVAALVRQHYKASADHYCFWEQKFAAGTFPGSGGGGGGDGPTDLPPPNNMQPRSSAKPGRRATYFNRPRLR